MRKLKKKMQYKNVEFINLLLSTIVITIIKL